MGQIFVKVLNDDTEEAAGAITPNSDGPGELHPNYLIMQHFKAQNWRIQKQNLGEWDVLWSDQKIDDQVFF